MSGGIDWDKVHRQRKAEKPERPGADTATQAPIGNGKGYSTQRRTWRTPCPHCGKHLTDDEKREHMRQYHTKPPSLKSTRPAALAFTSSVASRKFTDAEKCAKIDQFPRALLLVREAIFDEIAALNKGGAQVGASTDKLRSVQIYLDEMHQQREWTSDVFEEAGQKLRESLRTQP